MGTKLSVLDSLRIVTNLSSKAVDACLKFPREERFLDVTCWNKNEWATLRISNSFDGTVHWENRRPVRIENDRHRELGISSVERITKKIGGLLIFDVNTEQRIFTVSVHIPIQKSPDMAEGE